MLGPAAFTAAWVATSLEIALIGVEHFAQDRTGFVVWLMKAKGSAAFATGPCSPWSIIVTDNILHILFMAGVAAL